ncbi:MAG: hypothetical protein ABJB69_04120 [Spartobacteria bacterium]
MLRRSPAFAFAFLFLAASSSLRAQNALPQSLAPSVEAITKQATPEKAWLDLRQNAPVRSTTQSAPGWVESVTMAPPQVTEGVSKSVFRIRLTKPPGDYYVLFFRLFFDDKADAQPELVAWDEVGMQILRSGPLGSGVDVATSESVIIPAKEVSTIDIEVAGDGKTVRGAYMDWMTISEVVHPVNADHRDITPQPFASLPPLRAPEQDMEQFGTVTATLAAETIRIGSTVDNGGAFQFGIESQPLLALITFEVASPRVETPPEVYVNGENVGAVTLSLPELADPGYRGEMHSLANAMQFHYTGWLRAQKIVPVSSLKIGTNDIVITAGGERSTSAIRGTQIQLKYLWDKSDYLLNPAGE